MLLGFLNPVTAYRVKQYTFGLSHIHITAKLQVMTTIIQIFMFIYSRKQIESLTAKT
jgi:hypothetical protein